MLESAPHGHRSDDLVTPFWWRWGGCAAAALLGVVLVVVLPWVPWVEGRNVYRLSHALAAAPFVVGGLVFTERALRLGTPETQVFWRRWRGSMVAGLGATVVVAAGALADSWALLGLGMICLAVGTPLWVAAMWALARAHTGRWSFAVDLVDSVTSLVVLVAPSALLLVGTIRTAERPAYLLPLILIAVFLPGSAYLSLVQLGRVPPGERSTQVIGLTLAVAALANVLMQVEYMAGSAEIPLRVLLATHTLNMTLLFMVPLWARRRPGRDASEGVVRRSGNLVPYLAALVLPVTAAYVLVRGGEGWEVAVLVTALVAVVVFNAVRQAVLASEARRLSADVARMAEERRHLLAGLLHGVERDRQRTVTELHAQALGSVAVLGAVAQTAQSSLPSATASQVKEAIGRVQRDLSHRADELRQLMVAMRGPVPGAPEPIGEPAGDDMLTALLLAFAAELYQGRSVPEIEVDVAPSLRLDWSTATIAYRITQEALLDVAADGSVTAIRVSLAPVGSGVQLEVQDDGTEPRSDHAATMRRSEMELFAYLAQGEVHVREADEGGRIVSCRLGFGAGAVDASPPRAGGASGRGPGPDAPAAVDGVEPEDGVDDPTGAADTADREDDGELADGPFRRGHLSLVVGPRRGLSGSLRPGRSQPGHPGQNDGPPQQPDPV